MNKKDYLKIKEEQKQILKRDDSLKRITCFKCFRPKKICLCSNIIPIHTTSRFIILIHPMEAKKEKIATGRLTHLCLDNSEMITGIDFTNNNKVNELINDSKYRPFLLYPGQGSHNISQKRILNMGKNEKYEGKAPLFFIIDGTWPHAKSMMKKSKNLHLLERMSFDVLAKSKFDIKQQPSEYCLCTIESVWLLIDNLVKHKHEALEKDNYQILLDKLKELVDFQVKCTTDPNLKSYRKGSYKKSLERPYSKKWKSRSICYEGKND